MEFIHEAIEKDCCLDARITVVDTDLIKRGEEHDPLEGLKHWHRSTELIYVIKGEQYTILNGQKVINHEDDLLIINSSLIHACGNNSDGRNITLCVQFDYKMLKNLYKKDVIYFNWLLNLEAFEQLKQLMKKLYSDWNIDTDYKELLIKGDLYEIYYSLSKLIDNKYQKEIVSNKNYLNLQAILDYIDLHYDEPITLATVAKEFNYSISYITKTFKKFSNVTFKEYLTHIRLINSENLLINSSNTISEIALRVGFPDMRAFGKAFKNKYQTTPQHYRKVYQN